jgi:ABC-type oligopeptide transport system substrate-binding subunit
MAAAISNGTRTIAHCPVYGDALMIASALSATNSEAVSELASAADELTRWYGPFNPTKHPPEINGSWLRLTNALAKLGSRAP